MDVQKFTTNARGMMRREFLKGPAAAAVMLAAGPFMSAEDVPRVKSQTVIVYRSGELFKAMGMVSREELASDQSASKAIQSVLDMFQGSHGGRLMIEPGHYPLDQPIRPCGNTSVEGSGPSTILSVTPANEEGIGILCKDVNGVSISDLCVDGDLWTNKTSMAGVVLDGCEEALVDGVSSRNFNKYGFHVRNLTVISRVSNCSASNNQAANFFFDYVSRPWPDDYPEPVTLPRGSRIIPNLITDCFAYGGGHGFDIRRSLCHNFVGCMVYQAGGIGFYVHDLSDSTLISGCRTFQIDKQAVFIENASEINISSSIFCWQKGHGIELQNCTWGCISGNEVIDAGASSDHGGMYSVYMHGDVKGVQVTGNTMWNWPQQFALSAGIYEDATCVDNSIVSNSFNYFTAEAVIAKGKNTQVAMNQSRKNAYPVPAITPFSTNFNLKNVPDFQRTRLENYFKSRDSGKLSEP